MLEPSFVSDRLMPIDDPQYRQLVELILKDGQALPILVRPHPVRAGIYQIAYGHRRSHAARELAVKVRAIIQTLSDTEFVIAQGKENAERRNLSFIERAYGNADGSSGMRASSALPASRRSSQQGARGAEPRTPAFP